MQNLGPRLLNRSLNRNLVDKGGAVGVFATASLDLRFALQKTLDPRITFTRASSATFVDSSGVLQRAVTNLLPRSEEFDNASWAINEATITANQIVAPNGTTTADLLTTSATTGVEHYILQSFAVGVSTAYTASVYAKAGTGSTFDLQYRVAGAWAGGNVLVGFNLSTQVVTITSGTATASITTIGNGWFRCQITATSSVAGGSPQFRIATGDGSGTVFLWGAQLEQASAVGEYVPTTSVINSAPRFDHAITSSTTNLLPRSEEFGASWTSSNITVSSDAIVAPNGTLTADKAIATTTNSAHQLYQVTSGTSGVTYTISFYVKAGEYNRFNFGPGNTATGGDKIVTINLSLSNPVVSQDAIFNSSAFAVPVGNGWYRVGATFTATATGTMTVAVLQTIINNAGSSSFTGDGTSGIYLWGAQLEQSSTVGPYVPTTTAAATSNTTDSLGLMVEEARTNLLLQSEDLLTTWTANDGLARTANQTVSPNGSTTADLLASGGTLIGYLEQPNASSNQFISGTTYTYSIYLKKANTSTCLTLLFGTTFNSGGGNPIATWNLDTGVPTFTNGATGSMTAVGNGWYRCVVTDTATQTHTQNQQWLRMPSASGDVYAWGAQLEAGAFPTSYIPTTTATVTRAADVANITGTNFSSWYNQTEGTAYWEGSRTATTGFPDRFRFSDGTSANRWFSYWDAASNSSTFEVTTGSAFQVGIFGGASALNISTKTAFGLAVNNVSAVYAGNIQGTDTSVTVPTISQVTIGTGLTGTIKRLTYWPTRLSNTTIQQITQP
jgi:hypothetical protein